MNDSNPCGWSRRLPQGGSARLPPTTPPARPRPPSTSRCPRRALPDTASLTWYGTSPQPGSEPRFDADGDPEHRRRRLQRPGRRAGDRRRLSDVYGSTITRATTSSAPRRPAAPARTATARSLSGSRPSRTPSCTPPDSRSARASRATVSSTTSRSATPTTSSPTSRRSPPPTSPATRPLPRWTSAAPRS